jgi:predicted phage tail protein
MRWSATVPGIAGAAALTWGVAMVVHGVFHQVPSLGAALVVGGVFGLLADRRL